MTKALGWTCSYFLVLLMALFGGPLLSKLPFSQAAPLAFHALNGSQTVRVLMEGTGLVALSLVTIQAYRWMPDNGSGFSFLRKLVFPLTALVLLIVVDRTIRAAEFPLIDSIGSRYYRLSYASGLTLAGLWVTAGWLSKLDSLRCFFSTSDGRSNPGSSPWADENTDKIGSQSPTDEVDFGAASPPAYRNSPGMLGRYKILKELGRGAMGVVYLGKDPTIQRFVAIKTMRLDGVDDYEKYQAAKARFFREAESAGHLSHPNIVTIFDAGEEDDLGYIAMELLHGTTLKKWSRAPHLLALDKLLPILATVADALDYAHQRGVVHRDVKPANIMLTDDQVVKVMDFGIAHMTSSSRTTTHTVMGTPTYMSPEQIAGKKVDGRSDIFSLGVVTFELLTGCPPFTGDNVPAVLFAIANAPHPKLSALRTDLPPALQDILDRALQKNPIRRYRQAGELARDLRSCLKTLAA
ncbi:serine/threonine-protein kinase [Candidatus Nitrospira inopinata]|jgi:serine/threonine-protein kinase|uniref:non-specific serine/threonine protein kinase n=1 Tax=Candidatus Nitrospira inopinata TaxID=1715989 RepID=A0A0S4KX12_9BACT|nr:serine/threonine-protein kinase [Candidatus Nitrospira inopinata]CUQ66971.1 putative serine/threonine protein kinase [Candidatus Nitrospira inopinata]